MIPSTPLTWWQRWVLVWRGWRVPIRAGVVVALVGVGVLLGLLVRPAYRWAKDVRASHLIDEFRDAADEARLLEAVQRAHAAYQLAPANKKVVRAMAELYGGINSERSLGFWRALLDHPDVEDDDREAYVRYTLALRRADLAGPVLAELRKRNPRSATARKLQALWHQARGEGEAALSVLRSLLADDDGDDDARLALALALLEGTSAKDRASAVDEARALLLRAMGNDGNEGLAALEVLARRLALTPEETLRVAERLETHPLARAQRLFWKREMELRSHPERRERVINEVVAAHRQSTAEDRARAARWLNLQRAHGGVRDIIPLEQALTRQDFFLIWADSMALDKQWGELKRVLEQERVPVEPELVLLFRARAARELGEAKEAQLHWDRAAGEAMRRPEILWYMARYAERLGETRWAVQVYSLLTRTEADPREAWLSLVRVQESHADTPALLETLRAMARHYPNDPAVKNDLLYLRLLLKDDPESAAVEALRRVEDEPRIMAYRVTASLGLLRAGEAAAARRMLDEAGIADWSKLQPSWQAVYAAVLGASGDRAGARALIRTIPAQRLKPEENALLMVWR
jgi:tetratricopeptide (TPR) repeat protein